MQTNPNIDDKRIVEIYDWKDTRWVYDPKSKKINRRLRRKRLNKLLTKQAIETAEINKEICEEFKYCDGENLPMRP